MTGYARVIDQQQNGQGVIALCVIKVKLSVAIKNLKVLRSLTLNDVLHEEEIGRWRRTHYSSEINSSLEDGEVIIMGWVSSKRDHGNILFIIVRDRYGEIQVIAKKSECSQCKQGFPIKTRVYRSKYTKNDCYCYRRRCGTISNILLRQRSIFGSKSTIV